MILHKPMLLLFSVFFTAHYCSDNPAGAHLETTPLREPLNWDWPEPDSKSDSNTSQKEDQTTTALQWDWPEMTEESQSKKQPKKEDAPKESLKYRQITFSEKKNWRLSLENLLVKADKPLEQKFLRRSVPQVMCGRPWNISSPSANPLSRYHDSGVVGPIDRDHRCSEFDDSIGNRRIFKFDDSIEVEIRGDICCKIRISPNTKIGELKILNKGDTVYSRSKETLKEDDVVQKQLIVFKSPGVPGSELFVDTIIATPMVDERLRRKPFLLKPFKFPLNWGKNSRIDIWNKVGEHYGMILEKILSDDEAVFVKKAKEEGLYISEEGRYIPDFKTRDLEQRIWVRVDVQKANFDAIFKQFEKKDAEPKCVVCLENGIEWVFAPCFHLSTCMECSNKLDNCPICRADIVFKNKLFQAGRIE